MGFRVSRYSIAKVEEWLFRIHEAKTNDILKTLLSRLGLLFLERRPLCYCAELGYRA